MSENNNFLNYQSNQNINNYSNSLNTSNISYSNKNNKIITFNMSFTSGQTTQFSDDQSSLFVSTFNKFIKKYGLELYQKDLKNIFCNAKKVDLNKSLLDNKIEQNSSVLIILNNDNILKVINKIFKKNILHNEITIAGRDIKGFTKKNNQDASLSIINVGGIQGFNLFGVLDGHGEDGHFVSQYCKSFFIKKMEEFKNNTAEGIYNKLKMKNFQYIINCFKDADIEMTRQSKFDYCDSGTTCTLVLQLNNHLICANVGDSRSILIYDNNTNTNQDIFVLSEEHVPTLSKERERIIKSGGIFDKYRDKYGNEIGQDRI